MYVDFYDGLDIKHLLMKSVLSLDFQHLSDIGFRLEADMILAANVVPI